MSEAVKHVGLSRWAINTPLKGWATLLVILTCVSSLIAGAVLSTPGSMVIYTQKNKPDFIQIFFPIGGVYSEKYSERTAPFLSPDGGVEITLPQEPIDFVRIDPANEIADIVITKIELKYFFDTVTLMPSDLLAAIKPIQMIGLVEETPAGILIRTTGNDPAFEMQLKRPSAQSQFIKAGVISILISLLFFFGVKSLLGVQGKARERILLVAIPFLVSLLVAMLFYPGFMSYDTLHALRSARNGVTDSMWPPMVSYVWRAVDLVSLNPSAMHFSQIFLLLISIFFVIFNFTKKFSYAAVFLLLYLSVPAILGTVAVIWKDVLMAAFFLSGFAVIVFMRFVTNRWLLTFLATLAIFLIFLGVCSRHNAITGAVPLLFFLAWVVCSRVLKPLLHLWLGVILLGSVLTGAVFVTKIKLDTYSLPGLVQMNSSNDAFLRAVRVLDVAGASLCVGSNLFADMAPNLSLADIESMFDPRHVNLSRGLLERVGTDGRIDKIWMNVAFHHPICFFSYKFQLTKYMVGANDGAPFLITHPYIDNNEYGYSLPASSLRNTVVAYIGNASQWAFFKPWFLYLASIVAFIYLIWIRALTASYLTLFLSALFYFAGLVLFGNAADARLPFYATTAFLMVTGISVFEFMKKGRAK